MIGIITVGFNSLNYLEDFFLSLEKSTFKNFKIVFVDNNSSDDSLKWIKKNYPDTIIVPLKVNKGVLGYNIGINKAKEIGCKFIFLVNPDTVIEKNCLSNLKEKADEQTILQPLVLIHERGRNTNKVNTTGGVLNYLGFSYCSDYQVSVPNVEAVDRKIAIASAVGELIPIKVLSAIGVFDDKFFMYHDDVDFSWRARIAGFQVKLIAEARIWHKYHFGRNKTKMYYAERNRLVFMVKNYQLKTFVLIFPMFLITEILMLAYSVVSGWGWQKICSYGDFMSMLPHALRERSRVKKIRKVADKKLYPFFSTSLQFSEIKAPGLSIYSKVLRGWWKLVKIF